MIKNKTLKKIVFFLLGYAIIVFGIFLFESNDSNSNLGSVIDIIWYSIVTLTTVGYGDFYPVTTGGRILSLFFVFGSLGILGVLISQLNIKILSHMEDKKYGLKGINITGHTLIFGLNKFSAQVASEIINVNKKVIVLSDNKTELDAFKDKFRDNNNLYIFYCEYDNYNELSKINIETTNCIYVSFLDDSETLIHILNIKSKFQNLKYIVNLNKPFLKETFKSAGVLFSISQEEVASKLIASYIFEPNAASIAEDLLSSEGSIDIQEYRVVKGNPFLNKSYEESFLLLKQNYNSILVALFKEKANIMIKNPNYDVSIEINDRLIFIADSDNKAKIEKDFIIKQGV